MSLSYIKLIPPPLGRGQGRGYIFKSPHPNPPLEGEGIKLLMTEMTHTGEDHRNVMFICGSNDFIITH